MARGGQIKNALVENQVGLALPGLQQFCLARASFKRDHQAAFDGPDRNHLLAPIPRQDTVVEPSRTIGPERSFDLIAGLVCVERLCRCTALQPEPTGRTFRGPH